MLRSYREMDVSIGHSCDLRSYDMLLWGYIKLLDYANKTIGDLKKNIETLPPLFFYFWGYNEIFNSIFIKFCEI